MKRVHLILFLSTLFVFCSKKSGNESGNFAPANLTLLPPGVTAENPPLTPVATTNAIPVRGILAIHGVAIEEKATVNSDISVLSSCSGHSCPSGRAELSLGEKASVFTANVLKADTIRIAKKTSVPARLEATEFIIGHHAIAPNQNPLVALPELPPFLTGTPGTTNVQASASPLAAGKYAKLKVHSRQSLVLSGGFYHFTEVSLDQKSVLTCAATATCVVLVTGKLKVEDKVIVQALSNSSNDLTFYISGAGSFHQPSATIGRKSHIIANIYAANAALKLEEKVSATGIFIGKWVKIGQHANVTGSAAPTDMVTKLFEAGIAGTIELSGKIALSVPACALTDDTIISVRSIGALAQPYEQHRVQKNLRLVGEGFDMQPNGLVFNCPVLAKVNYSDSDLTPFAINPAELQVMNSSSHVFYEPTDSTVDTVNKIVTGNLRHFSLVGIGRYPTTDYANKANAAGVTAFIATSDPAGVNGGLRTLNVGIAPPGAPLGFYHIPPLIPGFPVEALDIQVLGNTAFVAEFWTGFHILDVSVPSMPTPSASLGGNALAVKVNANLAYIGNITGFDPALDIWDITNPSVPVFKSSQVISTTGVIHNISYANNRVYIANEDALRIVNVTNPLVQTNEGALLAGSGGMPAGKIVDVVVNGSYAYIAQDTSGVTVVDIANPLVPAFVMNTTTTAMATGLAFNSTLNKLFVSDLNFGVRVYDTSNPAILTLLESKPIPAADLAPDGALSISVNTGRVYVTLGSKGIYYYSDVPPTVISTMPADGAGSVAVATNVTITFSQAMNPATLAAITTGSSCSGTVQVSSDNFATCVAMTSALPVMSVGNTVATFTPGSALSGNTSYQIRVTTGPMDSANTPLAVAYQGGFTTITSSVPTGWYSVSSPVTTRLTSVAFVPGSSTAFAVGDSNVILRSTDSGENWVAIAALDQFSNPLPADNYSKITFLNPAGGLLTGGAHVYLITTPASMPVFNDITNNLAGICGGDYRSPQMLSATHFWITCGRNAAETTNGGATWTLRFNFGAAGGTAGGLSFRNATEGVFFIGGVYGAVVTNDGGASWTPCGVCAPLSGLFTGTYTGAVTYLTNGNIVVGGNFIFPTYGYPIRVSIDGGNTYAIPSIPALAPTGSGLTTTGIRDFATTSPTNLYAVGYHTLLPNIALILFTNDSGLSWVTQVSPVSVSLTGVSFASANIGVAVGLNGTIIKTQNGGFNAP